MVVQYLWLPRAPCFFNSYFLSQPVNRLIVDLQTKRNPQLLASPLLCHELVDAPTAASQKKLQLYWAPSEYDAILKKMHLCSRYKLEGNAGFVSVVFPPLVLGLWSFEGALNVSTTHTTQPPNHYMNHAVALVVCFCATNPVVLHTHTHTQLNKSWEEKKTQEITHSKCLWLYCPLI